MCLEFFNWVNVHFYNSSCIIAPVLCRNTFNTFTINKELSSNIIYLKVLLPVESEREEYGGEGGHEEDCANVSEGRLGENSPVESRICAMHLSNDVFVWKMEEYWFIVFRFLIDKNGCSFRKKHNASAPTLTISPSHSMLEQLNKKGKEEKNKQKMIFEIVNKAMNKVRWLGNRDQRSCTY